MVVAGPTMMHQHLGMTRPGNRGLADDEKEERISFEERFGETRSRSSFRCTLFFANYLVYNQ